MGTKGFIFLVILSTLTVAALIVRQNIKDNIKGKLTSLSLRNLSGGLNAVADIELTFEITNNSWFKFAVNDFKADIYNVTSGRFITENVIKRRVEIPKGVSEQDVVLLNNKIVGLLSEFASGMPDLLAVIRFRVFGINIKIEQEIKIS